MAGRPQHNRDHQDVTTQPGLDGGACQQAHSVVCACNRMALDVLLGGQRQCAIPRSKAPCLQPNGTFAVLLGGQQQCAIPRSKAPCLSHCLKVCFKATSFRHSPPAPPQPPEPVSPPLPLPPAPPDLPFPWTACHSIEDPPYAFEVTNVTQTTRRPTVDVLCGQVSLHDCRKYKADIIGSFRQPHTHRVSSRASNFGMADQAK
eukprot:364362-Chlamydomonas_euryale.AAC.26